MPPMCTEPASLGFRGSVTSYWRISPVPQQATYKNLSSMDKSMSVTSGGTAPNPCRSGGNWSFGAGSAGMVAVFSMWNLPPSRHQVQIEPSRFVSVDDDAQEAVLTNGIVGGTNFQCHLMVGAKINRLDV